MGPTYRFPGVNSFKKGDKAIFKGREQDTNNLFTLLMLSRSLVMHSESGTGKSSLVQAGLLNKLEEAESNYLAVIINLNDIVNDKTKKDILTNYTIEQILKSNPWIAETQLKLYPGNDLSLWVIAKKMELHGKKLLLILDQFETLQSFSNRDIQDYKMALFELVSDKIPTNIYKKIHENIGKQQGNIAETKFSEEVNSDYRFLSSAFHAKLLFVIREDKLGTMSLLCDYFPDILKNDFVLPLLTRENAFKAIVEPARAEGHFMSMAFNFEIEQDLKDLINVIADDATGLVDPMQLQIVASTIEKKVVISQRESVIKKEHIPPISDIIHSYYEDCWEIVKAIGKFEINTKDIDFDKKRKQIIDRLVVNDRRNLVHSKLLISNNNASSDLSIITALVKVGLIRSIPSGSDIYYQLCHDRFIKPVADDLLFFEDKEKTRLKEIEAEREKNKLEEEKVRQQEEIKKQKEYIKEIKKAQELSEAAQEEALHALIEKEDALSELQDSNDKLRKYRNLIITSAVLILLISIILLKMAVASSANAKEVRSLTLIDEAKSAYQNEKHDIAFRKLYSAYKDFENKKAKELIDSFQFFEISGKEIVYNTTKTVVASIYADNSATIWNIQKDKLIKVGDLSNVGEMRISNSGKYIACTNISNSILRILQINHNLTIKVIKDSITNKNDNSKSPGLNYNPLFSLGLYSFSFSPNENFIIYKQDEVSLSPYKLLVLGNSKSDQQIDSTIKKLIQSLATDSITQIQFSSDEKIIAIQGRNRHSIVYNLAKNQAIYKSNTTDQIEINDSLPIFYVKEVHKKISDINIINYRTNLKQLVDRSPNQDKIPKYVSFAGRFLIITSQRSVKHEGKVFWISNIFKLTDSTYTTFYTQKTDDDSNLGNTVRNAYINKNGILYLDAMNKITLVNPENELSTTFPNHSDQHIFNTQDTSIFFFYNGKDTIFKLSRSSLKILKLYVIKNLEPAAMFNDSTIICIGEGHFAISYNILSKSLDTLRSNIESIDETFEHFILGEGTYNLIPGTSSYALFKIYKLKKPDQIEYFNNYYPSLPTSH